jgi:hypothetical protein
LPKPDRPRWRGYQQLGLLRPAGVSKWQIPLLTLTDHAGARHADMLPDRRAPASSPCSNAMSARTRCSARTGTAPTTSSPGHGRCPFTAQPVTRTAFHIQTINNLHSRFESFMKPFCGPATKNLPGYAVWFITRLTGDETGTRRAA